MTAFHPVASRSPDRTGVCCAGRSVPSQCEMVTGPGFSSPNQPDQERTTAYRDSSGPDSRSDAHCATNVGDWEEPSGESRFKRHGDACATSVTVETMLERLPAVRSRISLLAGERNRALVWNPWKYFCTLVVCRNSVDGVSLFRDAHHFSNYGRLLTYDDFAKFVGEKIGDL